MTTPQTPWWKRRQVLGLAAVVLVAGAIVAGVLGTRSKTHSNHAAPEAIKVQAEPESGNFPQVLDTLLNPDNTADAVPAPATTTTVVQPQASTSTGAATTEKEGPLAAVQSAATNGMLQQQAEASKLIATLAIASTGAFCSPKTAEELHAAVDNRECSIILLSSTDEYKLHKAIVISRPLVIVGSPVFLPVIDGFKNERIFHVVQGGYLEVRFVRLFQGVGRLLDVPRGRPIHLRLGTVALVEIGGRLTVSGCVLETRPQTVASFFQELEENITQQRLTIGGYIAVLGGTVDVIGCTIWRFRPLGNPNFVEINVGRDVLVVAGTLRATGNFYTNLQLFHVKNSAGGIFCVLGGNLIITGLALNTITGANAQFGTGLQVYVGGGNCIMTGVSRFTASVVLARAGFGLFSVSAGNLVVTGYTQASARGASADFGTATFSVGAGTLTGVGTALSSYHITRTSHVAGGYWFNGAGVITIIGNVRTNQGTSTNQHGIGLHICNVAGVTQVVGASSYTCAVARAQIAYGTDTFMAAGFLTWVRVLRYRNIFVGLFIGNGNQLYVGAGAGVFIRNRQAARVFLDWRTTRNVYTIAGTQTGRAGANTDLYMDATGRYNLTALGFPPPPPGKRVLALPSADDLFPRSFALVVDDKFYQTDLVVPSAEEIEAVKQTGDKILGLAFFRAAEKKAPLDLSKNVLQVSTNNTDCLACDLAADRRVGETPCAGSNQCAGKSIAEILHLDETPEGLNVAASKWGWAELSSQGASTDSVPARHKDRALQSGMEFEQNGLRPDVWVLEGELFLYCERSEDATGASKCGHDYRTVRKALAYVLGDIDGSATDFSVSVWDKKAVIKAELSDYLDVSTVASLHESVGAPTHKDNPKADSATYGFTVTVTKETKRDLVSEAVTALTTDSSALTEQIDELDTSSTTYLASTVNREGVTVIPGFPNGVSPEAYLAGTIAPTIVVLGEGSYSNINAAKVGQTYSVSIANFPRGKTISVELFKVKVHEEVIEPVGAGQFSVTVPLLSAKSVFTQAWTVPADLPVDPTYQYFLRASVPGIKLYKDDSPLFAISA